MQIRLVPIAVSLALIVAACSNQDASNPGGAASPETPAAAAPTSTEAPTAPAVVDVPVSPGGNEPLPIIAGQSLTGSFIAPQAGSVQAVSVEIGNNLNTADGQLGLKLCQAGVCAEGQAPLAGSVDNQYFAIPLASPLSIVPTSPVEFTLTKNGGSVPVAVWTYAVQEGGTGMTDSNGASIQRTPRLGLTFAP